MDTTYDADEGGQGPGLRIGDLARLSGISVRMLHHYDRIGLLVPSARTVGGHREYSDADATRLEVIVGLRALGFSLDDIGALLAVTADPRALIAAQLAAVEESMSRLRRARARLKVVEARLARAEGVAPGDFLDLARTMAATGRALNRERLDALVAARRETMAALGGEAREALESARRETLAALDDDARDALRSSQRGER